MAKHRFLYSLVNPLLNQLRSSHFIIRSLFGVNIPRKRRVQFDPTALLLGYGVKAYCTDNVRRTLELGIGQAALVSLTLARHRPLQIFGLDCSPSRVAQSREVAAWNKIDATFFESNLFSEVAPGSEFDLIFFNPPYVPTEQGRALRFTERWGVDGDQVWDGGDDGTDVLARFLEESPSYLTDSGRLLFGVQNLFIPDSRILEVIQASSLKLESRYKKRWIPSTVYVLSRD